MYRYTPLRSLPLLLVFAAAPLLACDTPVYRYALENWAPLPYEILIFHHGKTEDAKKFQKWMDALTNSTANLATTDIDVDEELPDTVKDIWAMCRDQQLPVLAVRYPENVKSTRPAWSGTLNDENVRRLLTSPARKDIAKHLANGDAAVWLMIDGTNKKLSDEKSELLQTMAVKLAQQFNLDKAKAATDAAAARGDPVQGDPGQGDPGDAGPEHRAAALGDVRFSVVRVSRNDPEETFLTHMLFEHDETLMKADPEQPEAFLLFGRGRALGPLPGPDIREPAITDASSFLSGPCMCQIKEQNPGMDLLIDANWEELVRKLGESQPAIKNDVTNASAPTQILASAPALAPVATVVPSVVVSSPVKPAPQQVVASVKPNGLAVAVALIGLGIAVVFWSMRKGRA